MSVWQACVCLLETLSPYCLQKNDEVEYNGVMALIEVLRMISPECLRIYVVDSSSLTDHQKKRDPILTPLKESVHLRPDVYFFGNQVHVEPFRLVLRQCALSRLREGLFEQHVD